MNPTFLIVEDEPITARFIREVLEGEGYNIAGIAKNGTEARRFFSEQRIDIVLMDINIKGGEDGIQLARSLADYDVAIIYISAYSDKQTLDEASDTLPYGFLVKPFKETDLIAMVSVTISRLKKEDAKPDYSVKEYEKFGEYKLDMKHSQLHYKEYGIPLSKNEMRSIELFFRKPECVIPIDELREFVWDNKRVGDSTIRELINRIRNKVAGLNIENIYGIGYKLRKES